MKLSHIIECFLDLIQPVIKSRVGLRLNFPIDFTFLHVLERIKSNLDSLSLLIDKGLVNHEHSIGLISRNLITDFITIGYIVNQSKSVEMLYENLYSLYNSDLKKVDYYIKTQTENGFITKENREFINERYNNQDSIFKTIRDYSLEFKVNKMKTIQDMIGSIDENDELSSQIKNSYHIWLWYSKYEHIGWYSYDLTRNGSDENAKKRLIEVLIYVSILLRICFEYLNENHEAKEVLELSKKINSFFMSDTFNKPD